MGHAVEIPLPGGDCHFASFFVGEHRWGLMFRTLEQLVKGEIPHQLTQNDRHGIRETAPRTSAVIARTSLRFPSSGAAQRGREAQHDEQPSHP